MQYMATFQEAMAEDIHARFSVLENSSAEDLIDEARTIVAETEVGAQTTLRLRNVV